MPEILTIDKNKIINQTHSRELKVDNINFNEADNTIEFSFSSEAPYYRKEFGGHEVLSHKEGEYDFSLLNSGRSLFSVDHEMKNKIGFPESAEVIILPDGSPQGRVKCKFDDTGLAREYAGKVRRGELKNVSAFYTPLEILATDHNSYRLKWQPYEISLLEHKPPADISVGVGRSLDKEETITKKEEEVQMPNTAQEIAQKTPQIDVNAERAAIQEATRKEEITRIGEINAMGEAHKMTELSKKYVNEGRSADEMRTAILDEMVSQGRATKAAPLVAPSMDAKDVPKYSIMKGIRQMVEAQTGKGRGVDGLEFEASQEIARQTGKKPIGIFVPEDLPVNTSRDMNPAVGTAGGYLVATDLRTDKFIELQRNKMLLKQLGAQTMSGLVGDIAIPGQDGASTMYWFTDGSDITAESQQTLIQRAGTPKHSGVYTDYTRGFINQSSISTETFARNDLTSVVALGHDLAGINGSGVGPEPQGIINTPGIGDVTANAVPTNQNIIDLETDVAAANADVNNMAILTTPEIRGLLKNTLQTALISGYIWKVTNQPGIGMMNGYPAYVSNQVPKTLGGTNDEHAIIFGDISQLVFLQWGGIDISVDKITLGLSGGWRIIVIQDIDLIVRNPAGFSVIKDARLV